MRSALGYLRTLRRIAARSRFALTLCYMVTLQEEQDLFNRIAVLSSFRF